MTTKLLFYQDILAYSYIDTESNEYIGLGVFAGIYGMDGENEVVIGKEQYHKGLYLSILGLHALHGTSQHTEILSQEFECSASVLALEMRNVCVHGLQAIDWGRHKVGSSFRTRCRLDEASIKALEGYMQVHSLSLAVG